MDVLQHTTARDSRSESHWYLRPRRRGSLVPVPAAVAVAMLVLVSACGGGTSGAGKSNLTQVKVLTPLGLNLATSYVLAEDLGYFKEEGIDVKIIGVNTLPDAIAGLVSGEGDVVSCNVLNGMAPAIEKGLDVRIISGVLRDSQSLMASPKADLPHVDEGFPESLRDLEGKSVGVYALGGATEFQLREIFNAAGLDADKVHFQAIAPPAMLPALTSGRIDAGMLVPPGQALGAERGLKMLFDFRKPDDALSDASPEVGKIAGAASCVAFANAEWVKDYPQAAQAVHTGIEKAVKWAQDERNSEEMAKIFARHRDLLPPVSAQDMATMVPPFLTAEIDREALESYNNLLLQAGSIEKPLPLDHMIFER